MAGTPIRGEAGKRWASVGLADHVLREMENHERVWSIKGHDPIHIGKRLLCLWGRDGFEGARVGKGDQVGARSHRAGSKRYGGRDGWVWPDSRERNKSKIYSPRTT